ncbi:hypothetical protein G6671_01695 [Polynucleobacter paneuropaeus]|nr:hypothetical protein G6671_01695 [Polynucleobacter paneuropaeus]
MINVARIRGEILFFIAKILDLYIRSKRIFSNKDAFSKLHNLADDFLTEQYCEFNKKELDVSYSLDNKKKVLIDCFPIPIWVAANSILANQLGIKFSAEICSFGEGDRDPFSAKVYPTFGCHKHLRVIIPLQSRAEMKKTFLDAIVNIKDKHTLFNWQVSGIQIGDELYESYLRVFSAPTVKIGGLRYLYMLYRTLKYYYYFAAFLKKNNVVAAILSHDIYIETGILSKICWANEVPVYLASGVELKRVHYADQKFSEFEKYSEYFSLLSKEKKLAAIAWSKQRLSKRFSGEVGVDMTYSTKTAFQNKALNRQLTRTDSVKIIIATHCFFDNPRAYGGNLFKDFYEWITFLGEISLNTDYEWYIKTHRDYLPGTMEVIEEFLGKYKRFKLINSEVSWHQLKQEGASVVLTCYGTVGHELPLIGVPVINSGYNPHVAYKFNIHAKTVSEYAKILSNLSINTQIVDAEKIYEFYYVHHQMAKSGGYIFDSYEDLCNYIQKFGVDSNLIFEIVINGGHKKIEETKTIFNHFIDEKYFSLAEKNIYLNRQSKEI